MARPLRKLTREGASYERRSSVEAEIAELERLDPDELVARCQQWPVSVAGTVSPEALLYFVRTTDVASPYHEPLLRALMQTALQRLPKPENLDGKTTDLGELSIRDRVMDKFVDRLLGDQAEYDDKLDYFEINFNGAMAKDRLDASAQVRVEQKRSAELLNENDEISTEVEQAVEHYNPFDPDELDKKDYRRLLNSAIDTLPSLQKQIIEMLRHGIPIMSIDPSVPTISKVLNKAEKTIRNQRDRAFVTLRRRLERKEGLK